MLERWSGVISDFLIMKSSKSLVSFVIVELHCSFDSINLNITAKAKRDSTEQLYINQKSIVINNGLLTFDINPNTYFRF